MNETTVIKLHPRHSQCFYRFSLLETSIVCGTVTKNEITKLLHTTWQFLEQDTFLLHLEAFDREHLNRTLSLADKDFYAYAAMITDDIKLRINALTGVKDILNFGAITQKAKEVTAHLGRSFVGDKAEQSFRMLNSIYSHTGHTIDNLVRYNQYGLLLHPHCRITGLPVTLRHYNLLEYNTIEIQEEATLQETDESGDEIILATSGQADLKPLQQRFFNYLERNEIPFAPDDMPVLDHFSGQVVFDRASGLVKKNHIAVTISCGAAYSKKVVYSLNTISHEEV